MTLSEFRLNQEVWHPSYGKGKVVNIVPTKVLTPFVEVKFDRGNFIVCFWADDELAPDISHLYPHPVTVIATEEVKRLKNILAYMGESFVDKPVEVIEAFLMRLKERREEVRKEVIKVNQLQSKTEK